MWTGIQEEVTSEQNELPPADTASAAECKRLTTLLRLVPGAWALALYEDAAIQRRIIAQVRAAIAPLPLIEISLVEREPDPLAIVRCLELPADQDAPVVCFTGVGSALDRGLYSYLDLQRETLAQLPHRLLFWVTLHDLQALSRHAPNFYSRINGIFRFPGRSTTSPTASSGHSPLITTPQTERTWQRHRPYLTVEDEAHCRRRSSQQEQRINALINMAHPDPQSIADAWYDLGGLYEKAEPYRWSEAEAAYTQAARYYGVADLRTWQAEALVLAGEAARRGYAHTAALEYLQQAQTRYRQAGVKQGEAHVLLEIGKVQQFRDEVDAALRSYQAALTLYQAVGDRLGEANTLKAVGDVQRFRDEREAALRSYQAALEHYRAVRDRLGEANVLKAVGDVQQFRQEMDVALGSYAAALEHYRAVEDRLGEANVLKAVGNVQQFRGEMDAALHLYQQALGLYCAVGDRLGEANVLKAVGDVQQFRKEMDAALHSYQQALGLYRAVGARLGKANVLLALGDMRQFRGEVDAALCSYQQALGLYQVVDARLGEANVLAAWSGLLFAGDPAQSQTMLDQALALRQAIGDVYGMGADLYNHGLALINHERYPEALTYLQRARDCFASRNLDTDVQDTDKLIAQARAAIETADVGCKTQDGHP